MEWEHICNNNENEMRNGLIEAKKMEIPVEILIIIMSGFTLNVATAEVLLFSQQRKGISSKSNVNFDKIW